ncbi:MAG: ACP S-malonyltransferase [Acidobacteriaceae bacterium]
MKKIAFLFPGQGSQMIGMGRDVAEHYPAARHVFDEADEALRFPLTQLCWSGPDDRLKMTEVTQPAILTASIAALRVLEQHGVQPSFCAGHSLGEYSAHVAAGTITFPDAVRTVRNRGRYMQDAVPPGEGAMAAVLGLKQADVEQVCAEIARQSGLVLSAANINAPEQIVISGAKRAVDEAMPVLKQRGAKRVIALAVSAPFHCALMQPARERLAVELKALEFKAPRVPVVTNVDAVATGSAGEARQSLIEQVTAPVLWVQVIERLIAERVELFIEVGPGKVLCGLLRQIDRAQSCLQVEDEASLQKTLEALSVSGARA